ncbi:MAG: NADH:flavin oxidoreductase, partial [Syntrophaceae bacterium]|nr:NADH:flavin oxidoreductase [Syntrophaceae bacterium]
MSILFTPGTIGEVKVENRFVHSATYECMATRKGEIKEEIIERYRNLAREEVGLIITGHMYVHLLGRAGGRQIGIYTDEMIPGLKRVVDAVHNEGGKIVFQLAHAGRQTRKRLIGETPIGPSTLCRDPVFFVKPREMTVEDIYETIESFGKAAYRSVQAGADGIQLHAAHGYLISQFLSPFFNKRTDAWGGSDENRFRFLREIILTIKKEFPRDRAILIKMNAHDYTPKEGVTPPLAAQYARWLGHMGIDGIEISCGTGSYSFLSMSRGDVPVDDFVSGLPWWMKYPARRMLKRLVGQYPLQEAFNLEAARSIKPAMGDVPLMLVGGLRHISKMEEVLERGHADFISMSRPFIREPHFVKRIREGKLDSASCVSC